MTIMLPYIPGQRDMNAVIYTLLIAIVEHIVG